MATNQDSTSPYSNAIYTGFWIDWDHGKILGARLTLKDSQAAPFLATLAIIVTLAGNRSWHLCRLFWHSILRQEDVREVVVNDHRRKQQVIVRNSDTAGGATISLFGEWFTFGIRRILRIRAFKDIILGCFVVGHWLLFIALGILVSQVVIGKVVVSRSLPTCGQWVSGRPDGPDQMTQEELLVYNELELNKTINADNYVRSCYPHGGSEGMVDCNRFITQFITHEVSDNAVCPFESTACYPNDSSAIILESGNMTLSQLGLNTKYGKDISIQRQSTCAVWMRRLSGPKYGSIYFSNSLPNLFATNP